MFLKVPVSYRSQVTPKRASTSRDVDYGEFVEVHVAEVSGDEAPVACRWTSKDGSVEETRWFDGSHWRPSLPFRRGEPQYVAEVFAAAVERGSEMGLRVGDEPWQIAAGKLKAQEENPPRSVEVDRRGAAIQQAHEMARDFVFVDGLAWKRAIEPHYVLRQVHGELGNARDGQKVDVIVVSFRSQFMTYSNEDRRHTFSADRWDDMVDHAGENWRLRHPIDPARRIDVFVPEAILRDDEAPAFIAAVDNTLNNFNGDTLKRMEADRIGAWVSLRDASVRAQRSGSDEGMEEMAAAVRSYLEVFGPDWRGHDVGAKVLASALSRWEMRPMAAEAPDGNPAP